MQESPSTVHEQITELLWWRRAVRAARDQADSEPLARREREITAEVGGLVQQLDEDLRSMAEHESTEASDDDEPSD